MALRGKRVDRKVALLVSCSDWLKGDLFRRIEEFWHAKVVLVTITKPYSASHVSIHLRTAAYLSLWKQSRISTLLSSISTSLNL